MSLRTLLRFSLKNQWRDMSLLGLTFSTVFYRLSITVADPDLWGHVRFGQDIWAAGRVVELDPYSYLTVGQRWVNHEWLAELVFYGCYSVLGTPGLVGFKVVVCMTVLAIVYRHLLKVGLNRVRACIIVVWVAVLLVPGVSALRPQLFTYGFFLLLIWLLQKQGWRTGYALWLLPAIFAVWVNLHGGFLAGVGILLLWVCVRIASALRAKGAAETFRQQMPFVLIAVLSGPALLLNPYGADLLRFLAKPETVVRPEITEWASLPILSTYGGFLIALAAFAATSVWLSRRPRDPALVAVLAATAVAALVAFRHAPLLALAIPILAGEHISDVWSRWMPPQAQQETRFRRGVILAWCSAYALILTWAAIPHFRCIRLDSESTGDYPVQAVALLRETRAGGNMAVFFNWGEYALWHLSPRIKVSADGRRETVYSDLVYRENLRFAAGQEGWDALLVKYQTDLALVNRNYPAFSLMKNQEGWVSVYEDGVCGLFAREGHPDLNRLLRPGSANAAKNKDEGCFP